jgi:hypothetical protein
LVSRSYVRPLASTFTEFRQNLKMEAFMKWRFALLGPFVIPALCLFAMPTYSQTTAPTTKSAVRPSYDIAREVTIVGTVNSVVSKVTPEMKMLGGSHLILETSSGMIDASLGLFRVSDDDALSVTPGQRVQVTGVMKTIRDQQVFVTRLALVSGHVYTIRNEHGFVLVPLARERNTNPRTNGAQL